MHRQNRHNQTQLLALDQETRQSFAGMAFPFGQTVLSVFGPKDDDAVIRTSVEMILKTRPGERVMRPEFGAGIEDLLFEQNDEVLAITLRGVIEEALSRWEDRIVLGPMDVQSEGNKITVRMALFKGVDGTLRQINADLELDRSSVISFPTGQRGVERPPAPVTRTGG
jgi:phage baseplate assembly protein W